MNQISIIPDSSFFICFLDDIEQPQQIITLLDSKKFIFFIGKITNHEICKSNNIHKIEPKFYQKVTVFDYFEYGEVTRMFFSESEVKKGEHEVLIISFILSSFGDTILTVIDDLQAKKFFRMNFSEKIDSLTGTVGFVGMCCCQYKVFIKEIAIDILESIRRSKFYVPQSAIEATIETVKTC